MAFSVDVNWLMVGPREFVPADKIVLSPPKLKRKWDEKPGFGIQGAFCVYTGEGLATFDVTFTFWDELKEAYWDSFASRYLATPKGTKPPVISIYHPLLMKPPFKIQNVQMTEVEGWSLVTPGRWQTRISLLECRTFAPFKPQKSEPKVPSVEKKPVERPKTAQDERMVEAARKLKEAVDAGAK